MPPQETDIPVYGIPKKNGIIYNDSVDDKEDKHFVIALDNELKHWM